MVLRLVFSALFVFFCGNPAASMETDLWSALRSGAVVLFRHANAPGIGDPQGFRLGDCNTQRNLGAAGRTQAAQIGTHFRAEAVPIARILSSEWCRAIDTAEIAFPGRVEREPAFNSFFGDRSLEPGLTKRARAVIDAWHGPGTLVIFTHDVNIRALTGIGPMDAEGVVVRPGPAGLQLLGRIRL